MEKDSFVFRKDWYIALKNLNDVARLEVYDAIMREVFEDGNKDLSPEANIAMMFISPLIKRDIEKYNLVCERRKLAGSQGGIAKASKSKQMVANGSKRWQKVASVADNDIQDTNVSMCISNNQKEETDTSVSFKKKKNFVPPTLEEVELYIKEKNFNFNAKDFIDYYEADDWHYGKDRKKVSNWKRCCLTWEQKRKNDNFPSIFDAKNDGAKSDESQMSIPSSFHFVGDDGKHYESLYDMTRHINSFED